jgi:hypothetical protein
VTKNAADDRAGADEAIVFSPISVPDEADRARGRRRRRLLAGAAAVVVVAGGITAWAVAASGGDSKPAKHTAVIPQAFAGYTEAKPADSLWTGVGGEDYNASDGEARITYLGTAGAAARVTVQTDPTIDLSPGASSDPALSQLTGSDIRTGSVTSHPAGAIGGTIKCADIGVGSDRGFTECAWQDKTAAVTFVPVKNKESVVSASAADDLRAFLAALRIEPKKG